MSNIILIFPFLLLSLFSELTYSATFTFRNQCTYTVWPGILSGAGTPPLSTTGFSLNPGDSLSISAPQSWSGRMWGRTYCSNNPTTGKFTCLTGDCASGNIQCNGAGAIPPATLAEFTLNGADNLDFYDISLVDGYNLPMLVVPQGGTGGNCNITGCVTDLNGACPAELRVTNTNTTMMNGDAGTGQCVACRSACEAFGDPRYCCSGDYSTPQTCRPTEFSEAFKRACPSAYSYAYDDSSSTFTCDEGADYVISFCPTPSTSQRASEGEIAGNNDPLVSSGSVSFSYTTASLIISSYLIIFTTAIPYLFS